jgi:phosphoglycolate phosphatase-like HAD superfamily hydrolase
MADVKLGVFGIRDRFAGGAFGDEAPDRNELAKLAVRRAAERHGVTPDQCIVVGDTELDVACARAAGARAVAVATGGTTKEALAAAQPDLLLGDLEDAGALIRWASGGE